MGSPQVINCTVSTVRGVESNSVKIGWMRPGGRAIISDSRVSISQTTSSGNDYTSNLRFTHLMEGDDGTYTCNIKILETNVSQSIKLQSLTSKLLHECAYVYINTQTYLCSCVHLNAKNSFSYM